VGYTKVIRSGSLLEIYEYRKNLTEKSPSFKKSTRDSSPLRTRRSDNLSNTKKRIRRLIRANVDTASPPSLITLTMLQILPPRESWAAHTAFILRLRSHLPHADIRYISVLEYQKRGAIHFHTLIWGIPSELIENEKRTRNLQHQWLRGFLDCILTDGDPALAGYLTKYLSKSMRDPRLSGQKAYSASRNMLRPMSVGGNSLSGYMDELVDIHTPPLHVRQFDTHWLGGCSYRSYLLDTQSSQAYGNAPDKPNAHQV